METSVLNVFLYALITAICTGLGAIPFLFVSEISGRWLGISNALAAGLMGAASWGLIQEASGEPVLRLITGMMFGVAFMVVTRRFLDEHEDVGWGGLKRADAIRVLMILGVMTLHSFTEGVSVGVSFGGGETLGAYITAAIAVHNIPEGLAISLVMIPRGSSVWKAGSWSIFTSLPQPLMAVPAFLLVELSRAFLPVGLGFAAAAMIWMVIYELIPEALEEASRNTVAVTVVLSIAAMLIVQAVIGAGL